MERHFEFEYAGHTFELCTKSNNLVVDMFVVAKSPEGVEFLKNEEYGYRCFVYGRSIWLKRKESHV
jgi:hypothetical protein